MLRLTLSQLSDHPLDDRHTRGALLDDFSRIASLAVLNEISAYLHAVTTARNLNPIPAFEIVDFLDRAGARVQQRLTEEFLTPNPDGSQYHQGRLWTAASTYWARLAAAYRICLPDGPDSSVDTPELRPYLPKIICRALRACSARLKWIHLRHGPVQPKLWYDFAELHRLAEQLGLAQTITQVYPRSESSIEREFLRGMMLAVSSADALTSAQIEIVALIIAQVASHFQLSTQPGPGTFYVTDRCGQRAPGRFSTNRKANQNLLCFGPAGATAQIQQMSQFIDHTSILPPELMMPANADVALVYRTLLHLLRYWSSTQPERKRPRRRRNERIGVVHGYAEVVAGVSGRLHESSYVSNEEEWTMEDESEGGFGAFVPNTRGAWIELGSLIGLRREDGVSWGAGVVRRVTLDEEENCSVGIEMFASGGSAVTIRSAPQKGNGRGGALLPQGELCVLIGAGGSSSFEVTLLMRANIFSYSEELLMHAYDREYLLLPTRLLEHGAEFDLVRYRIIEQHENAA